MEPREVNAVDRPKTRDRLKSWSGGLNRSRLQREIDSARLDTDFLASRTDQSGSEWKAAVNEALRHAEQCYKHRDTEGGWSAVQAARRRAVFGMTPQELQDQRIVLLAEARSGKLTPWRGLAITEHLSESRGPVTAEAVADAMFVRDEWSATQYFKISITGDQIWFLLLICSACCAVYLGVLGVSRFGLPRLSDCSDAWSYRKVASVLLLGLLGAALSTLRGLLSTDAGIRTPERIANRFATIARLLSGVIAGLAGYIFWMEGIIPLDKGHFLLVLSIPFIFGFLGERLVIQVAQTLYKGPLEKAQSSKTEP